MDQELFSIGDVFYQSSKTNANQDQAKNEKLEFYQNFEKNLKINMIKEKLENIALKSGETNAIKSYPSSQDRFLGTIIGKLSSYIQGQISITNDQRATLHDHQPNKHIKLKKKIKPLTLNVLEIEGIKKLYRYKRVLLFNKKQK